MNENLLKWVNRVSLFLHCISNLTGNQFRDKVCDSACLDCLSNYIDHSSSDFFALGFLGIRSLTVLGTLTVGVADSE